MDDRPAPHPYRWTMLAGVWLLYFCFGLVVSSPAPLVGPITGELGLTHGAMGAVLGAWPLVYIASAIPCGIFLDRVGLRWSLALAGSIMGLSALLRAVATDYLTLYLGVAVFGLGGPLVSVGGPKLIALWFGERQRGFALGLYVSGPALGALVALSLTNSVMMPLLGGQWRSVLVAYALVAFAAAGAWLAIATRPASRALDDRLDAETGRSGLEAFGALVSARPVQIVLLMGVGIFFFNHGITNWLPEILRSRGMDPIAAGYWASLPAVVGVGAGLAVPHFARPSRRVPTLLALFAAAGLATLLIHDAAGPLLAVGLLLQGIARGSMTAVATLLLIESPQVAGARVGAAGGLFFSAAEIGGVLGPLTIGTLHDWTGGFGASLDLLTGVCVALMLLLGLFKLVAVDRRRVVPAPAGR